MRLTEEEVQRLRENGFSDQDINEYAAGLEQQAQPQQAIAPVQPTELPTVSEVDIPNTPQPPVASNYEVGGMAIGSVPQIIEGAKDLAIPAGGLYGAYKAANALGPGIEAWRQASAAETAKANAASASAAAEAAKAEAMSKQARAEQMTERGRMTRAEMKAGRTPTMSRVPVTGPVSPSAIPPTTPVVRESVGMRNMPTTAATGTAATGALARGAEYAAQIRELAAQKALQAAPTAARVGVGTTAALMPGNVGQNYNVPTAGPLRGSEINPATRRPWTPEELARYNAQYNR